MALAGKPLLSDRIRQWRWVGIFLYLICSTGASALQINGTAYTDLKEVAARLGMSLRWIERGQIALLESEWTRMRFEVHQREMLLNNRRVHLGFPVAQYHGHLLVSESDYRHQIQPILTPQIFGTPPRISHIVIDPGHGGEDPGAENEGLRLREKSLTLDLAKRLKTRLEANGFRVSMTRNTDRFIPLAERAAIANRDGADLFLSLHFNALDKPDVSGVETFAFTPPYQPSSSRKALHSTDRKSYPGNAHDPWNTLLGYYVQRSLADSLPVPDRGLKRARFVVLRELEMPGILVEGGFVSHPREGRNIGSAAYRDRIAAAISEGVLLYRKTATRLADQ